MSIAKKVRNTSKNPVSWYYGFADNKEFKQKITLTLRTLQSLKTLSQSRIGLIGGLAMTFYNMEVSTTKLKSKLGVDIFHHDIHELTNRMSNQSPKNVDKEIQKILNLAKPYNVSKEQLKLTAQAVLSLRDIKNENNYSALAVSDWPALQEIANMHPGAAFSILEEVDNIPVASEGDILGAISQIIAKSFTGKVGYLLDMTEPDFDRDSLLMWHGGGGPLYLANKAGVKWVNHPMIGRGTDQGPIYGTISDLVFQVGSVSVFRISNNAKSMFYLNAKVEDINPNGFTGCRGWLTDFRMNNKQIALNDLLSVIMMNGIEHHFVLVPGDICKCLKELEFWTGMKNLNSA
jgi:L-fucose isomerase-like protein